jgi:hypothetical protein
MADDRIDLVDWCDVAAVGMVARDWFDDFREEHCVRALLAHESHAFCKGLSVYQPNMDRIASALREAHEAGREESRTRVAVAQEVASYLVSILPLTPAAIEIMSKELARLQDENRTLRRELAARRAVDEIAALREELEVDGE